MEKHELTKLEGKIKEVVGSMSVLSHPAGAHAAPGGLTELLTIIHRPGWTTIAEVAFVNVILDSMLMHARALNELQGALVKGSLAVGTRG